jgi:hypothetical protein
MYRSLGALSPSLTEKLSEDPFDMSAKQNSVSDATKALIQQKSATIPAWAIPAGAALIAIILIKMRG